MGEDSAKIKIQDAEFDLGEVLRLLNEYPGTIALILLVAFVFWVTRPGGLASDFMKLRHEKRQQDAKIETERRELLLKYRHQMLIQSGDAPDALPNQQAGTAPRTRAERRR